MKKGTSRYSIEYWKNKGFSEEDSIKCIENIKKNNRENSCWCKEFWIKKGFSEEEALQKIKEKQLFNSNKQNKNNIANVYLKEYWVERGFSEIDAIEKINNLKNKCSIINLSDEKIYNMMIKRKNTYYSKSKDERKKINKSRGKTKQQLIDKFGEERTEIFCKKRGGRTNPFYRRYSKISEKIFNELQKYINAELFYGKREKWIRYNKNKGFYVDLLYDNKIIEFNGNFYHANPLFYDENSEIMIAKSRILKAKEIWKKDEFKINTLKKLNYQILIIWENEIDDKNTIQKCLKFLQHE